jgi:hypothetical protein
VSEHCVVRKKNAVYESRFLIATASCLLALALPILLSIQITNTVSASVDALLYGDTKQAEAAVNQLKWLPFIPQGDQRQIVLAYSRETNVEKKELLKKYYKELTGEDIDLRLQIMND